MIDEHRVSKKAIEDYLAKRIAEKVGEYTGADVVALTRCVVDHVCKNRVGWDALKCVVDNMDKVYETADRIGVEGALREFGCPRKAELV